jgi:hypothetical protein
MALETLNNRYDIRHFDEGGSTGDPIAGLYQSVLGRAPDAAGLAYWQGALSSGQDLGSIESAFRGSQEAQSMGGGSSGVGGGGVGGAETSGAATSGAATSGGGGADSGGASGNVTVESAGPQYNNAQPIQQTPIVPDASASLGFTPTEGLADWYQKNLGREADTAGLQHWSNTFGSTLDANEIAQLQASPEYSNRQAISGLYDAELGREPDPEGLKYWAQEVASGKTLDDIQKAFNESKEGVGVDIFNLYENVLGRKPDEAGLQYWLDSAQKGVPRDEILKAFQQAPEFEVAEDYVNYLGRTPDAAGSKYYQEQLASGRTPQEIARDIAFSDESIRFNSPSVRSVLETTLGKNIADQLSQDQINRYTREILDPNRIMPGTNALATQNDNLRDVYRQIALDPVLGSKLKAENPEFWEQVTPLERNPQDVKRTERIAYGDYGFVNVNGVDVPKLNARVFDNLFGADGFGTISDFSHGRGNLTNELGWSSNSFSNKAARGAEAIGVTTIPQTDEFGNTTYTYQGLDEAARVLGLDTSKFQDKQVQATTKDQYDSEGQLVQRAGEPAFQTDASGNRTPVMQTISRDQQLYDAINQSAKDIYLYTGDSLTPGNAKEGGAQSFDTVLYKRSGDKLIPITAPVAHGGQQNMDVYRPKDYGFAYYAQGPAFVAASALSMAMADPSFSLAAAVGSAMLPAAASAAIGATATGVVGATILGSAVGALSSTAAGADPGKGALTGAVTGLVASGMKPLLSATPVASATKSIADASQGLFSQAQVGNIIGATIASTFASAASGANGDQILNSFKTSLISSGLSEKAAQLAVAGVKEAFGDDPKTLARTAAATRLVTRTASTAALSGKNPEQIQAAVIATLVQNAANIAGAGTAKDTTKTTKVSSAEYNDLVDALGGKQQADAYLAGLNQDTGRSPYYDVASGITSDQPVPLVSKPGFDRAAYDQAILAGYDKEQARIFATATGMDIEISGVGQNPKEVPELFVPDPNAMLPDVYDIMARSQNSTAGGDITTGGNTFVRGLPVEVIDAILMDQNAPTSVREVAEKIKQEKETEKTKQATKGGGNDSGGESEKPGGGGTSETTGGSPGATGTPGAKTSAQQAQQTELIKQAKQASDATKGDEQAEIVVAVSLVIGLTGSGSSSAEAIKKAASTTGLSEAKIKAALDARSGTGGAKGTTGGGDTAGTGGGGVGTGSQSGVGAGEGVGGGTGGGSGTGTGGGTGAGSGAGGGFGGGTGIGAGGGSGTGTGTGTGAGSGSGSGSGTGFGLTIPRTISPFLLQQFGGIQDLAPGLTAGGNYSLSGIPSTNINMDQMNPNFPLQQFAATSPASPLDLGNPQQEPDQPMQFATGGSTSQQAYNPYNISSGISGSLTPGLTKARLDYLLTGLPQSKAEGGSIEGHNPQFFSEGGLGSMENTFVEGDGDGTSDQVPAMLANGEFVIPADVVSGLGNGSNDAGAEVLQEFLKAIREHKHSGKADKLPPESKGPLAYLTNAKRKVKVA